MKDLRASRRFTSDFEDLPVGLRWQVMQEVATLRRKMVDLPSQWASSYQRVHGIGRNDVLEMKIGGASRLIMCNDPDQITLLAVGDHETTTRVRRLDIDAARSAATELPADLRGPPFPPWSGDGSLFLTSEELSPAWCFALGADQASVGEALLRHLEEDLVSDFPSAHMILGGAGTGKTIVLLWLLMSLSETNPQTNETWTVKLEASDALIEYVQASSGWPGDAFRFDPASDERVDVLLVDDPGMLGQISERFGRLRDGRAGAVVAALDPFQLDQTVTDQRFFDVTRKFAVQMHRLKACYRQKAELGAYASEFDEAVLRAGSAADLQRVLQTQMSDLTFVNLGGVLTARDPAHEADWEELVEWLRRQSFSRLWSHWPPVLFVHDAGPRGPRLGRALRDSLGDAMVREIALDEAASVRGVEFQHVVLVLDGRAADAVFRSFASTSAVEQNRLRLLRIPITRARDSLSVLVFREGD